MPYSSDVTLLSASFSRKADNSIGNGKGALLLDLILKKSFSASVGHIHSTLCNARLFQYIKSRNDTFLPPTVSPSLSLPLDALPSSHHLPQLSFPHPLLECLWYKFHESEDTTCRTQGPHCRQDDIPAHALTCTNVLCLMFILAPYRKRFFSQSATLLCFMQ